MIQDIDISKIFQHPDNPRKQLGDLTELAESIRVNGIFQNLTVIPCESSDTFTVIIGHRRLAAAKLAGLKTVPCIVTEMDYKTQLSTMLLENMQRADLTFYEQGQGFQMMFDLGVPVKEIAEKTGFAETTVRKRLAISKLPEKKMKDAEERGGKLEDYIKVCEIEDEAERNKLLETVGTNNFEYSYASSKRTQAIKKNMPGIKKEVKAFAVKGNSDDRWSSKFEEVLRCDAAKWEPGKLIPEKIIDGVKYIWVEYFSTIYILKPAEKKKKDVIQKSKKEKAADERRKQLKQVSELAFELRKSFISEFSSSKKYEKVLNDWMLEVLETRFKGCYSQPEYEVLKEVLGQKKDNCFYISDEILDKYKKEKPENYTALICWCFTGDSIKQNYVNSNYAEIMPEHKVNNTLNMVYKYLCKLGYQMSDDEIALQDGTYFKDIEDGEGS